MYYVPRATPHLNIDTMHETEHYYYTIPQDDTWLIVKAHNQREMRRNGYDTAAITSRWRHYDDASHWLHHTHHPGRIRYISLTGVDFVD